MAGPAMRKMTAEEKKEEEDYRAREDLRVLTEAAKIKADDARHSRAMKMARAEMKALKEASGK